MVRRLLFGCAMALLYGAVASCTDATGPSGGVRITVTPDTLHVAQGGGTTISYRISFATQFKVWPTSPKLETEATPGDWRAVADPSDLYLQAALGDATATEANGELVGFRPVSIGPGRYRLRVTYQVTGPSATQPTGEASVATSNTFVVVTP